MKILVVGGGGREHAIIKKLKENRQIEKIYALPGNGGIASDAECVAINAKDIQGIVNFAKGHAVDYAVVAPDDPLVLGAVDALNMEGIPCFGPTKAAAVIEGSKVFSKNLMKKYHIPTASYATFSDIENAYAYIEQQGAPIVIKADGLALGKGVILAKTVEEAKNAVYMIMKEKVFGESGNYIVIEEFLEGPEVSVLAFTDGKSIKPMISSMDHKRAGNGDTGLNTGGMGTVAPNPFYTPDLAEQCMHEIFLPTINAMRSEGREFRGCLYFGLMLTQNGPKVIEYNCRFGDPETQVVLPLLESDLFTIMQACTNGSLEQVDVRFKKECACCVVLASEGYPQKYKTGFEIVLPNDGESEIYIAGAKLDQGKLYTAGGRVLGVTAVESTLKRAIDKAYENVEKVHFANAYYRIDIGKKALLAQQTEA